MARTVCVRLADPPQTNLSITVPGVGSMEALGEFALQGYNACMEARSFLQMINPVFAALGMPLCILGCLRSITAIFDVGSFPPLDVGAIPKMIQQCKCLVSFTPFGFCGMVLGLILAVIAILNCMIGLLGDLVLLTARVADLILQGPDYDDIVRCMTGNIDVLQKNVMRALGPISKMWDSTGFLFEFVGVPFQSLDDIGQATGLADAIASLTVVRNTLTGVADIARSICP